MENIKFIHIAGTNGKGSTCAYIAHGLIQAGYKVGRFTSPHVLDVTERITVNNTPIDRERIPPVGERWFQELWKLALEYFKEQEVDYAVIETGIGGLLDCTNIITPVISVITKIGFDHMDILGNTIEEIASHKAGIIKEGVPVVTDPTQLHGAMKVIRKTAVSKKSRLYVPSISELTGNDFMSCNMAVAKEALQVIKADCNSLNQPVGFKSPATLAEFESGVFEAPASSCEVFTFSDVRLLGRMQVVCEEPLTIIDGAHNPCAVRSVLKTIAEYNKNQIIVFGMQKSKDYDTCIKLLADKTVITVNDVNCEVEVRTAIEKAQMQSNKNDLILIIGSLYLAGNALRSFT
jgi:dihydrofolate synthase/folylpolyglutamate synthase